MKRYLLIAAATLCAATALPAQVLDVEQNSNTTCMAGFSQVDLAQSFRPTVDNVAGAGVFLRAGVGSTSTVTIQLWDALPDEPSANMLASGSAVGSPGSWVDAFWSDALVAPGSTYYLVFISVGSAMCVAGDTGNPYLDGQLWANPGFGSFPTFDYTFRTWFNDIPNIQVTPPVAGQLMDITVTGLSSGSDFVLVMSSLGAGPTSTPFGTIEVTLPWRQTPLFPEQGGSFNWTSTVPMGSAGQTFYMQVVEFEPGGVTELSNPIAVPVN